MSSVGTDEYAGAAQSNPRKLAGSAQTEPTIAEVDAMLSSSSCLGGAGAQADPLPGDLPEPLSLVSQTSHLSGGLAGSFDALDYALLPLSLSREHSQRGLGARMDSNNNLFADDCIPILGSRQSSRASLVFDYVSDGNGSGPEQSDSTSAFDTGFCGHEDEDLRAAQRHAEAARISGQSRNIAEQLCAPLAGEVGAHDDAEVDGEPETPSTIGEKRGFSCFGSDAEDDAQESNSKRPRFEQCDHVPGVVVTLGEAEFEANLLSTFGAVKDTKLVVFKEYAAFFRAMEEQGIAEATCDPQGIDNCVFGWQKLVLVDVDRFFAEVKIVVRKILKPRDPHWDNALKNFYERMNELSIAPDGYRLRPEGGYFHRPSSTATKMRVMPKYEYNPQKANRTMKKRGWTKTKE